MAFVAEEVLQAGLANTSGVVSLSCTFTCIVLNTDG
jgi:hypothetical protein